MQVANKNGLELLDLKLKIIEGKQNVDCVLNLPVVLCMWYHQLATHIKNEKCSKKYCFGTTTIF